MVPDWDWWGSTTKRDHKGIISIHVIAANVTGNMVHIAPILQPVRSESFHIVWCCMSMQCLCKLALLQAITIESTGTGIDVYALKSHHSRPRFIRIRSLPALPMNYRCGISFLAAQSTQDAGRHAQCDASKWDLLMLMGVSTLHASSIKGKTFEFVCASRPVSCVDWACRFFCIVEKEHVFEFLFRLCGVLKQADSNYAGMTVMTAVTVDTLTQLLAMWHITMHFFFCRNWCPNVRRRNTMSEGRESGNMSNWRTKTFPASFSSFAPKTKPKAVLSSRNSLTHTTSHVCCQSRNI